MFIDIRGKMSAKILFFLILGIIGVNTAFAENDDPVYAKAGDYVYRKSDFERLLLYSPQNIKDLLEKNPQQRVILIKRLMEQRIVADVARKEGLDRKPEVADQVRYLIDDVLSREYTRKVMQDVSVSEEELREFYVKNKEQFLVPEQVRASHILIHMPPDATKEEKMNARVKADVIIERLRKGESFRNLAEKYSDDTASKEKGGDLGYIQKGRMAEAIQDVIFSLKPGQISEVIETKAGYDIVKIDDHKEARTKGFEEVKDSIKKQLTDERAKSKAEEFVKKASETAGLEIFYDRIMGEDELPKNKSH